MSANVVKIDRGRAKSQLTLPDFSEELLEAERKHDAIAAELAATRVDCETLTANFNVIGLKCADGQLFPYPGDGRQAALAELHFRISDLEAAKETARRNAAEARRGFEEQVSRDVTPAADDVCAQAVVHLEEAMRLVEMLSDLATEARKSGLTIQHHQIARADGLARQLHQMRGTLAPVPTMGVQR